MAIYKLLTSVTFWFVLNALAAATVVGFHFLVASESQVTWWPDTFSILLNLLSGGLISFLFYFLVVVLPERRKKEMIKRNLKKVYIGIKEDLLWQIIFASQKGGRRDLVASSETIERLLDIEGFRNAFQGGREGDEGWYAFCNHMSEDNSELEAILLTLRILRKQIEYILYNFEIDDSDSFDAMKRIESYLVHLETTKAGYDEPKALCGFLYSLFSGWNIIEGYRDYDHIQKTIEELN